MRSARSVIDVTFNILRYVGVMHVALQLRTCCTESATHVICMIMSHIYMYAFAIGATEIKHVSENELNRSRYGYKCMCRIIMYMFS